MATLNTQSFNALVAAFAAAVQSQSDDLVDFSEGSVLLAVDEAAAANALWLQALIVQVLAVTRAQTSNGPDLDTYVNQFGLTRLGSNYATGLVLFARLTTSPTAPFIPVGTIVKTSDGSQSFAVYADPTNNAYSPSLGGYSLPASVQSVSVSVQAVNPGSQGNIAAGAISLIASSIPGVDTATNSAAFTNGIDSESDAALRLRLVAYFGSLSKATDSALTYAIQSIQVGLQVAIHENANINGSSNPGTLTIFVDDGSGSPPAALIAEANAQVYAYRAAGISAAVYPASAYLANVQMMITTAQGFIHQDVVAQVDAAIGEAINATGLENTLSYYSLPAIAFSVAGVTNVSNYTLNGSMNDLVPTWGQTIKAGTLAVT